MSAALGHLPSQYALLMACPDAGKISVEATDETGRRLPLTAFTRSKGIFSRKVYDIISCFRFKDGEVFFDLDAMKTIMNDIFKNHDNFDAALRLVVDRINT